MNLPSLITRFRNPWVRYGVNKCEMCGKYSLRQMEVGLYWTCNKKKCVKQAIKQDQEDYELWK